MKPVFSRNILEKCTYIKFYKNPPTGSQVVSCRQTDGPTNMMKVIVTFRTFVNTPKTAASQYIRVLTSMQPWKLHGTYTAANENYAIHMFYHTVEHTKQSMSDNTTKENRSRTPWTWDNFISFCADRGLAWLAGTNLFLNSTNNCRTITLYIFT
jgi:hypothetical protein